MLIVPDALASSSYDGARWRCDGMPVATVGSTLSAMMIALTQMRPVVSRPAQQQCPAEQEGQEGNGERLTLLADEDLEVFDHDNALE